MLKKIVAKTADILLGLLVALYIVLEELVWDNIAEPLYAFIHGLKILQKLEALIVRLDRHALLVLFLALFAEVEVQGIFALKLMSTGKVLAGTALYIGKFPVAAFTFWLFNISKEKLMTFGWFKQSYALLMRVIDTIKASAIHRRIIARLKSARAWLKSRLTGSRLFMRTLMEKIGNAEPFRKPRR